jgi:hypothetical protein
MQLASSFGRNATVLRSPLPLSDEQIVAVAPSIFARHKHTSRSDRYTYILSISGIKAPPIFGVMAPLRPLISGAQTGLQECSISTVLATSFSIQIPPSGRLSTRVLGGHLVLSRSGARVLGAPRTPLTRAARGRVQSTAVGQQLP